MNARGISGKFRQLYAKCAAEVDAWQAAQEEAVALLGTCANVIQRLPVGPPPSRCVLCTADAHGSGRGSQALQDVQCYGNLLEAVPGLQRDLLGRQLRSLDAVLSDLRDCVSQCQAASARAARLAADAARQLRAEKLSPAAQKAALGAAPSLAQCVGGLQEVARMLADEARLKAAVVDSITYTLSAQDLGALQLLFSAEPNIDGGRLRDSLQRVLALDPI